MNHPDDPGLDPAAHPQPGTDAVLDDDIRERLDDETLAPTGDRAEAEAAARVKRRLLRRIADDSVRHHHTVQPGAEGWLPFGPGLTMKVLHRDGAVMSYLVRLAPGASLAPHRHPVDEECVVLEGSVQIGELDVAAGGYHLGRRGVPHARLTSAGGALIYLRGAVPERELAL